MSKKTTTTLKTSAVLPKLSQCASALMGNQFYSTKPGVKPLAYLGPPPTLNEIVKLDMLQQETPEAIKEIWLRYHANKDTICAVIPADIYHKLKMRAKSCPLFVFPLPGDKGYISILFQYQDPDYFMYTFLDQYKKYTVNAVPWLSAAHYTDLLESKGIVLMRADPNLEVLNTVQAQYLYNQTQIFLLDDRKFNIMQTFTYNPSRFDFNQVLKEIDSQKSMMEQVSSDQLADASHKVVEFPVSTVLDAEIQTTPTSNTTSTATATETSTSTNANTTTSTSTTAEKKNPVQAPKSMSDYKVARQPEPKKDSSSSLD
eukprot:gene10889-12691_t